MYPSDYGYATSGGNETNRKNCYSEALFNWNLSKYDYCKDNNYLYKTDQDQWTITPDVPSYNLVFFITSAGAVFNNHSNSSDNFVYPVVYLKSEVKIIEGDGTQSDPYTLEI